MQSSDRVTPLPDHVQADLRRRIREAHSAEDAARDLRLPVHTVLAGAAGARMHINTRQRVARALEEHGNRSPSLAARRIESAPLRLVVRPTDHRGNPAVHGTSGPDHP